ncbi:MAG: hypothetical protein M3Y42_18615, partial [Actinomycetota bacterium]|nr:hypothetical protein [Actinomycetota bacterium]
MREDVEDALAAARNKQAAASEWLAEAHDEAQSLIADAAHQAMLVSRAAEDAADQLVAQAQADAAEHQAAAQATAKVFREQAEELVQAAEREAGRLRSEIAAELIARRAEHDQQLADERELGAGRAEQILA